MLNGKNFPTLNKFCNVDINKFFLLLRKGIYPYDYMDSWERFNENTIPPKESFYSELNLENIMDKDYEHVKKVLETFEIKHFGEYHDLYVQCDLYVYFCVLMYLKILEISVLKYISLILLIFCLHQD